MTVTTYFIRKVLKHIFIILSHTVYTCGHIVNALYVVHVNIRLRRYSQRYCLTKNPHPWGGCDTQTQDLPFGYILFES